MLSCDKVQPYAIAFYRTFSGHFKNAVRKKNVLAKYTRYRSRFRYSVWTADFNRRPDDIVPRAGALKHTALKSLFKPDADWTVTKHAANNANVLSSTVVVAIRTPTL